MPLKLGKRLNAIVLFFDSQHRADSRPQFDPINWLIDKIVGTCG